MTSEELRKLADEGDAIDWYGPGNRFTDPLREAADEIERLTARMAEATQILRRCKATCSPARVEEIDEFLNAIASEATK